MTEYDTAILTQAAANAQKTIDRIQQSEKDPQRQYLALLSEGCRIGKGLTIAVAGGHGEIYIDDLIKADIIHTALNQLNPSFDGWPETPGIPFLTCTGNSAQELMGIFFAAVSNEIHRNQPEKIFYAIESDYPPATLPVDTLTVWTTAAKDNLQKRFNPELKNWRTVESEIVSLELKFEAEYNAFFEDKKPRKRQSSKEAEALAYLVKHPDATNKEIANAIGVHEKTVSRYKQISYARKAQKDKSVFVKGSKDKKGNLEAWNQD